MRTAVASVLAWLTLLSVPAASAQVSKGDGVIVLRREVLADDLYNLYSAETGPRTVTGAPRLWLGGWRSPEDIPRDRIFSGPLEPGRLAGGLDEVLALPDALVNDASVVPVPGRREQRMYFTALALDDVDRATERNHVWTARSADGGRTWTDLAEAIGQDNGVNDCGAWSPSAVAESGLLCVYYHGNSPCLGVYRTCFAPDGLTVARPTEALLLPFGLANVDVVRAADRYVMVGDALGLASFTEIRAVESADGRAWRPLAGTTNGVLVRADEGLVFTPHLAAVFGDLLVLLFSTRPTLGPTPDRTTLHRWVIWVPSR